MVYVLLKDDASVIIVRRVAFALASLMVRSAWEASSDHTSFTEGADISIERLKNLSTIRDKTMIKKFTNPRSV